MYEEFNGDKENFAPYAGEGSLRYETPLPYQLNEGNRLARTLQPVKKPGGQSMQLSTKSRSPFSEINMDVVKNMDYNDSELIAKVTLSKEQTLQKAPERSSAGLVKNENQKNVERSLQQQTSDVNFQGQQLRRVPSNGSQAESSGQVAFVERKGSNSIAITEKSQTFQYSAPEPCRSDNLPQKSPAVGNKPHFESNFVKSGVPQQAGQSNMQSKSMNASGSNKRMMFNPTSETHFGAQEQAIGNTANNCKYNFGQQRSKQNLSNKPLELDDPNNLQNEGQISRPQTYHAIQQQIQRNVDANDQIYNNNTQPTTKVNTYVNNPPRKTDGKNRLHKIPPNAPNNQFSNQIRNDYQPSEQMKKLLHMPLSSLQDYNNQLHPNQNASMRKHHIMKEGSIFKRTLGSSKAQDSQGSTLAYERSIPYSERCYSDKLQLEEKYLEGKVSPISQTLQGCGQIATELQITLQQSLSEFDARLQESKMNFLQRMPTSVLKSFLLTNQETPFGLSPTRIEHLIEKSATESDDSWKLERSAKEQQLQESQDQKLHETLKKEFGKSNFEPGQLNAIKSILKGQSCLFRCNKSADKSVVYKLPALLSTGLILFISSSINYMTEQVQSLPSTLFGACYNNLVSQEKSRQIQELVLKGEVRILFITIERILNDPKFEIPGLSFIVFDEPHYCYEFSSNFKLTHKNFHLTLKKRFSSTPILALVPQITTEDAFGISQRFEIKNDCVFPLEISHRSPPQFSVSRDEDPFRGVLTFFTNSASLQKESVAIYVEGRKAAEDLSEQLSKRGVANQTFLPMKTDLQKLQIINAFNQKNPPVLIIASGTDIGVDRSAIRRVIHCNLPKSPEVFAQEVLHLGKDSYCHLFLSDEDYFRARVAIFADAIERRQIVKFAEKLMKVKNKIPEIETEGNLSGPKRKRDGSEVNFSGNSGLMSNLGKELNPFLAQFLVKRQGDGMAVEPNWQEICSVKVSEMVRILNLRKDQMIMLFETFEATGDWLKYLNFSPFTCSVQLITSRIEALNYDSAILQALMNRSRKSNAYLRIQIPDLSSELRMNPGELMRGLKM